jgi:hypothetical protein
MAHDRQDRPAQEQGAGAREAGKSVAPGKVTHTSKLSAGGPALQRKASDAAAGAGLGDENPVAVQSPVQSPVQRKSAWQLTIDAAMDAAHRGAVAQAKADESATADASVTAGTTGSGQRLPEAVQAKMEQSFGADFSDVRVHEGQQATAVGARAYTQASDIHFAPGAYQPGTQQGQELLGHELTHVVQQRQGRVQASTQYKGVAINDDPSLESEADQMGARAARGDAAEMGGGAGGPGTETVQRDALPFPANLKAATTRKQIFDILSSITEAERTTALTTDNDGMKNAARKLTSGALLDLYGLYGNAPMTAHWMVFYANHGNHLARMTGPQWSRFVGFIGAEGVAEIRADATMFGHMVRRAPAGVLPPWDLLDAAGRGVASPTAAQITEAVNALSTEQKTSLRGRNDVLEKILPRVRGNFWTVIPVIDFPLLDAVKWMNEINVLRSVKKQQWAQLLAEAPKAEQDALIADATLWPLVERHCDPGVLQTIRQNTSSAANAQGVFDDPVQLNAMFGSVGAVAFLALATQGTMPAPQVQDIYGKIKTANKVTPTLTGLPRGKAMGADTAVNLRRWVFDTGENDLPILYKMFERRFGVNTGDTSAAMANKHADSSTTIGDFTPDTLRMSWPVMERLPPAQVEGNPRWKDFLSNTQGTIGNAYYWENAVVMGTQQNTDAAGNPLPVTETVDANAQVYWRTDAAGNQILDASGNPIPVDMNMPLWNATLRHEIGHAVDEALRLTASSGVGVAGEQHAGAWRKYATYTAFVDALIAANGGMRNGATWPAAKDARYRRVMIKALENDDTFSNQLTTLYPAEAADPNLDAGVIAAVWDPDRWTTQPWYDDSWVRIGGRCWQRAYDDASSLYSFDSAARASHQITAYQWRAPGEWFAEVYQVYYAEQEKDPAAAVGALLRSKDPQAAALMSGRVDRGHSPQDMRGGVTNRAPGT